MRGLGTWVGVVLLLAGGSALFFEACEKRSSELYTGFRGEARSNRYLAAQRLLEAMGAEVTVIEDIEGLDELPGPRATLMVPVSRNETWSQERGAAVLDWVRGGGHLVTVTWSLWDEEERAPDFILDPIGIRQYMWQSPDPEEDPQEEDAETVEPEGHGEEGPDEAVVAHAYFEDRDEPLEISFDPWFYLLLDGRQAVWTIADANGTHLMTVPEGEGYVTVTTDDYWLANATIGLYDHAELLWRVAQRFGRDGAVWLVVGASYPGAWELLWRHGWTIVVSTALLAAAWVWLRMRRFGPVLPDEPPGRRSLMEHIEAAGRFQLRHRGERDLLDSARQAVLARVRERHPGWLKLTPRELHTRFAEHSGIPGERIDLALAYRTDRDPERFGQRIATLEKIRKAL